MWLVVIFLSLTIFLLVKKRRDRMTMLDQHGIPCPGRNWLWGNMPEYMKTPNVIWDTDLINRFGPVCGYYVGAKPMILISDPILIDSIQRNHGDHFLSRPRRVPGGINPDPKRAKMLGNLGVPDWKHLRGILNKGFSPLKLKGMSTDITQLIKIFMSQIPHDCSSIDFYSLYQNLTLDLIGKTGFGIDSDIQNNPNDALKAAVEQEFSKSTGTWILKLFLCLPEIHPILQPMRVYLEKIKNHLGIGGHSELWELGCKTVEDRRKNPQASYDLLQLMLDLGRLDDDSVVANSVLFFEAGFETMSASLAFISHLLITHLDIQDNVRNEIRELLWETDGVLESVDKLQEFTYLDAVIKEGLRMYPPQTTFIGRSGDEGVTHTFTWNGTQKTCQIPPNVHIQVGLYQILNSSEIWEFPRKFNPRRFLDMESDKKKEQGMAYQPFGSGKRICIGRKYAEMVLKMVFVELLSKYKLVPSLDTEKDIEVVFKTATMTPKNGVFGKVKWNPLFS